MSRRQSIYSKEFGEKKIRHYRRRSTKKYESGGSSFKAKRVSLLSLSLTQNKLDLRKNSNSSSFIAENKISYKKTIFIYLIILILGFMIFYMIISAFSKRQTSESDPFVQGLNENDKREFVVTEKPLRYFVSDGICDDSKWQVQLSFEIFLPFNVKFLLQLLTQTSSTMMEVIVVRRIAQSTSQVRRQRFATADSAFATVSS